MAEIGTASKSYRSFINDFRQTFKGSTPFDATYATTSFHYVVVTGGINNLYLTSITTATGTKNLSSSELRYSSSAIGDITKDGFTSALRRDYFSNWNKEDFDIVLLCTVEAARSQYIFKQVKMMLGGTRIIGDQLKEIAQAYEQTQSAAKLQSFSPLTKLEYIAHYNEMKYKNLVKEGKIEDNTKIQTFAKLFL